MIVVAVARDQSLHLRAVDADDLHVVEQRVLRVAEIEHQVARVRTDARFERERQAPFVVQRLAEVRRRENAGALRLDPLRIAHAGRVVAAVGDHADRQAVDRRHAQFRRLGERARHEAGLDRKCRRSEDEITAAQVDLLHLESPLVESD